MLYVFTINVAITASIPHCITDPDSILGQEKYIIWLPSQIIQRLCEKSLELEVI